MKGGVIPGRETFRPDCWVLPAVVMMSVLAQLFASFPVNAAEADADRYSAIRHAIKKNRHLSAHMVRAVDTRTIKVVRGNIGEADIPVLVRMMGDKDYGVASAAADLLITLGEKAMPALQEATRSSDLAVAGHARDGLALLDRCVTNPAGTNPDACPPRVPPSGQ